MSKHKKGVASAWTHDLKMDTCISRRLHARPGLAHLAPSMRDHMKNPG